jgi:anti-anti-sigma factor
MRPFDVQVGPRHGHERRIVLTGELDLAAVPSLRSPLRRAGEAGEDVALELGDVTFIDLTAMRVITEATRTAASGGRTVTLASPSRAVLRLLDLMEARELVRMAAEGEAGHTARRRVAPAPRWPEVSRVPR